MQASTSVLVSDHVSVSSTREFLIFMIFISIKINTYRGELTDTSSKLNILGYCDAIDMYIHRYVSLNRTGREYEKVSGAS